MKIHHWGALLFALFAGLTFSQDSVFWAGPASGVETPREGLGSTRLVFYQPGGPYQATIDVKVRDTNGKALVDTTARGPWLVLQLPAGHYVVEARQQNGQGQRAWFHVAEGERRELALQFSGRG